MSVIDLENTIIPAYGRTQHMLSALMNDAFKKHGINLTREQWLLLHQLYSQEGLHQSALAKLLYRDKTSLTRLISNMESKGLVKRIVDPSDRRANKIHSTKKGTKIYLSSLPIIIAVAKNIEKDISIMDLKKVIKISKSVQDNINKQLNN